MHEPVYYTYLIKCIPTNQYYYGAQFGVNSNPSNLWKTYFTSSNKVYELIQLYGKDSFLFEIRKKFTNSLDAVKWEHKVLRRMKVIDNPSFLNQTDNVMFSPCFGETNPMTKEINKKILIDSMNEMAIRKGFESYSDYCKIYNPAKNPISSEKSGNWKQGKIWVTKDKKSKMITKSEELDFLSLGYQRGKWHPKMDSSFT